MKLFKRKLKLTEQQIIQILNLLKKLHGDAPVRHVATEEYYAPVVNRPNVKLDRHTKPWSVNEDTTLMQLKGHQYHNSEIAKKLGRTTGSIEQRLMRLRKEGKR